MEMNYLHFMMRFYKTIPFHIHISTMLLISLTFTFLSPLATFALKSETVPTIEFFKYVFFTPLHANHKSKNLKLTCKSKGHPPPEIYYSFYADHMMYGRRLVNSSKVTKVSSNQIIIHNVGATDTGTYRCVAKNRNGRVFKSKRIDVKVAGSFYDGEYISDPPVVINVELGKSKEIMCPIKTYPSPLKFSWGAFPKNKKPLYIQENKRIHLMEKGALFYSFVKEEDVTLINSVGGISCIMYNDGEPILSRKTKLQITKDNMSYIPPYLHSKVTGTTYLLEGDQRTLRCVGGGNPAPDITWFKDGVQITANDSNYKIDPDNPGKLSIISFRAELEGNYKCHLSNVVGSTESSGNVYLAIAPKLVSSLAKRTVALLGRTLSIRCSAVGTSPMRYEWYQGGRQLSSYENTGSRMEIKDGELTIDPVKFSHQGSYQCYAINAYGNTYSVTSIEVKEPTVVTGEHVGSKTKTGMPPATVNNKKGKQSADPLELKYIIIIACSGAVFIVLVSGGVCMYCRNKDDSEEIIFVPTQKLPNNDMSRKDMIKSEHNEPELKHALLQQLENLPPPPPSLTDHSDDEFSAYNGYKPNHPLYYNDHTMVYLMNHNKEEHLYADIPEDFTRCESATPSTEL